MIRELQVRLVAIVLDFSDSNTVLTVESVFCGMPSPSYHDPTTLIPK